MNKAQESWDAVEADIQSREIASPEVEWVGMTAIIKAAFGKIKEAKGLLEHQENIDRVNRFSAEVNKAWKSI